MTPASAVLLDTNALVWVLADAARLGARTRARLLESPAVHFSAVSVLEIEIKRLLGKLEVPADLVDGAGAAGLVSLAFTEQHARTVGRFPELARHDPFDRMLLAQARYEQVRLVTSDRTLLGIAPQLTLDARD